MGRREDDHGPEIVLYEVRYKDKEQFQHAEWFADKISAGAAYSDKAKPRGGQMYSYTVPMTPKGLVEFLNTACRRHV